MLEFYTNPNLMNSMLPSMDSQNPGLPHQQVLPHQQQQQQHQTTAATLSNCIGQTDVGQIKCEKTYEICEGCEQKIQDRYLMRVVDTSWHESCLTCCVCRTPLNHSCYSRNSKLYCKNDYYSIFGMKCSRNCSRCNDIIAPQEMVMRVNQYVYHLNCFICFACNQPLQKGEQFTIRGGQLICRTDLDKDLFLAQQYDDDLLLDEHITRRDGRRGPKRPRTILTSAQRRQFKASFEVSPKPCRKIREALAKDTGLSVRVVQVWFQNQRAKMKKIQRKAKNGEDKKGGGDDSGKDDKSIKQESPSSEHDHYLLDGSYSSTSQPLNPNIPFSPDYPGNSGDSMCSSDISMDDSNFDQLDEATSDTLQNIDFQHSQNNNTSCENNNNHLGSLSNAAVTHIDKLYLMQNSYFNAIEQ